MKITFAITVCNELNELERLIKMIKQYIHANSEILIQSDSSKITPEVFTFIEDAGLRHVSIPLNNDFAAFKNNIYKHCTGDWIFFIDADEYPHKELFQMLYGILTEADSSGVTAIAVPRINLVAGISQEHIIKWNWRTVSMQLDGDKISAINFPDYQWRLQKNIDNIRWVGAVHEYLSGFSKYSLLPQDECFSLIHKKTINKQIVQNEFYEKIPIA